MTNRNMCHLLSITTLYHNDDLHSDAARNGFSLTGTVTQSAWLGVAVKYRPERNCDRRAFTELLLLCPPKPCCGAECLLSCCCYASVTSPAGGQCVY